jgi:hypothetical protein
MRGEGGMTDQDFAPDDIIGIFMYGLHQLHVDAGGLTPDNDPDALQTIGALSVLVYRIAAACDTPFHMALSRCAVLTGALIASPELGQGDTIAHKWRTARDEVLELQNTGNR